MREITIEESHRLLLALAKEFHSVCERNEIPYFMLGGTMLGAVRHKGFIPWDDDMDFGIPREYFSFFIDSCKKDLPSSYKVLYYDNSDYAILGFVKLSDSRTVVEEVFTPITDEVLGVNIDVFPLDHTNQRKDFLSKNKLIRLLFKFQKLLFINPQNRSFPKRLLAVIVKTFCRIKRTSILQWFDHYLSRVSDNKQLPMYANYFGAWGLKELVPKEVFGMPTLYEFEDTHFYGVQHAHEYLKHLYGNYQIIPEESERHIHASKAYYINGC